MPTASVPSPEPNRAGGAIPPMKLDDVLASDRVRLIALERKRHQLHRANKPTDQLDQQIEQVLSAAEVSMRTRRERHAAVASPRYDDALPIAEKRAEIRALIEKHQVVIVCGETGSGKTTQLPKICLELGRGIHGMIGCTQPRRIAARTLASRLAQELGRSGSGDVAYKIRFGDKTSADTFVKVMTDGVLLAETHHDRNLLAYDTIIIDEAHERSLNIDFLLGYVKQLLPKRPDLKVIITSATIDPARFAKHFAQHGLDAPIIEVSGRTFPVEVRYRPEHFLDDSEDAVDIEEAVMHAVDELFAETREGDVLVFLPGEREIRDTTEALRKHHPNQTEVLALFARLSNDEQDRIFRTGGSGRRRIVLATNVAETSLTVPGIRYVIDTGVARVHRYSARQKIDMLQIEPISQASAKQRAGRCGRVAAGICIRLYAEEDHDARPVFTTPEILRTSLASVILRMKALGLGDIANFPFVEAPSPRMIEDGYRQLFELGAVDHAKNITALGWTLSKFPVDPAVARMLVAAEKEACLEEVLIIAAGLSVQDPRDRPADKQEQHIAAHEKFSHPQSEFLSYVNLWLFYLDAIKHKQSNRKLDHLLRENFLSPIRMREWKDVHTQLSELCASVGMHVHNDAASKVPSAAVTVAPSTQHVPIAKHKTRVNTGPPRSANAKYESVHRALLAGLITNVGTKSVDGNDYMGPRGMRFHLPKRVREHAAQKKERLKWLMAAELTETTRLYARTIASIEPEWIEQLASHLVTRSHYDPHWERKSGQVVAFEQVSLYGLIINPRRRVHYGAINPIEAREIFIRHGLVAGEVDTHGKFLRNNLRLVEEIEDIEAKARRQDVLIDDNEMFALYDAVIPADVVNMAGFERWRKETEKAKPHALEFSREQLMRRDAGDVTFDLFPKALKHKGAAYPLHYRFEPTHPMDGVTVTLPVSVINQVNPARFEWLTVGMLREKAAAYFKTLPQRFRSALVPVPDTVSAFIDYINRKPDMADLSSADEPLIEVMTRFLQRERNLAVPKDAWDVSPASGRVVPHLTMNFKIVDGDGKELAMSRDFAALREQFADQSKTVFSTLHRNRMERDGLTAWPADLEELPETINFEREQEKMRIRYDGYPGFVDCDTTVSIAIFDEPCEAKMAQTQGLVRLFMLVQADAARFCERNIKVSTVAAFQFSTFFPETKNHVQEALRQELLFCTFRAAFIDSFDGGGTDTIRSRVQFESQLAKHKAELAKHAAGLVKAMEEALTLVAEIRKLCDERYVKSWEHIGGDIEQQLEALFMPRFLREIPSGQLLHYPRYLKAIVMRLNKARQGAMERDLETFKQIRPLWQHYLSMAKSKQAAILQYRWAVEELRVGLFAQELRTPMPVSVKRVAKMWDEIVNQQH
ncbi:MAG: ATP-dependent RNA helicase HrpA [Rhodocyclaceae bacterium]|nr:ATP-dependent RNA helicase HrpA [Rhodocyclaceae bacterium]MCA3032399.1 ATP-dependent RNA helicase HrpA [Rhodocyclaceae bacterium]MCA3036728.1 ATP-dependent RNA helicase HrpA [Rhodocyclaceae bacterium]MCA3045072.1 ATP-dependent RNA helicase HrpA [Rhodocyclaceae bacterium]MCA3050048.1 ATP-dependent RNA helicase HrpA [Rhodocyclaceae bacterium]